MSLSDAYPCPVCQQGGLEAIVLMDAFACQFCRHILAADLTAQRVQVVDSTQALTWGWTGHRWQRVREAGERELSGLILLTAVVLITLPASVVWLAGAIFPPLEPTAIWPFATVWALLTLLAHLGLVLWLVGEYYQIPFYVAAKVRVLRLRAARRTAG
ncbi:MAG TPA: hypothetical protein V6D02_06010 [Candidatus Obscuribacterales bacterium]